MIIIILDYVWEKEMTIQSFPCLGQGIRRGKRIYLISLFLLNPSLSSSQFPLKVWYFYYYYFKLRKYYYYYYFNTIFQNRVARYNWCSSFNCIRKKKTFVSHISFCFNAITLVIVLLNRLSTIHNFLILYLQHQFKKYI